MSAPSQLDVKITGGGLTWFFAASPIRRSSLVNETKEGVVNEPCSLATGGCRQRQMRLRKDTPKMERTDLDLASSVVGDACMLELASRPRLKFAALDRKSSEAVKKRPCCAGVQE